MDVHKLYTRGTLSAILAQLLELREQIIEQDEVVEGKGRQYQM